MTYWYLLSIGSVFIWCNAMPLVAQSPTELRRVAGKILDDDGRPVVNATVILQGQDDGAQQKTTSQADGVFDFPAAKGRHTICISAPESRILNPCIWDWNNALINTAEAATLSRSRTIRARQGGLLRIRLHDAGKLAVPGGGGSPAGLTIGVWTANGLFHALESKGLAKDGSEVLELIVPYGENLRLDFAGKPFVGTLGKTRIDTGAWRHDGLTVSKNEAEVVEIDLTISGLSALTK